MNEPIGQHIVPRVYLKNFSTSIKKKDYFVDVFYKKQKDINIPRVNIKNICKINEFYTFDHSPSEIDKRWLEKYYANNIESHYNSIYNLLTNEKTEKITPEIKNKILRHIISQELRTPKIAQALDSLTDRSIDYVFNSHEQLGTEKKLYTEDGKLAYDWSEKSIDEAKTKNRNENRQISNIECISRLKGLVELKFSYHIMVVKYNSPIGLISSDRPVYTSEPLYSPSCNIQLPIDKYHMINLYPFIEDTDPNIILRIEHGKVASEPAVRILNISQLERAEHFVYGEKNNILRSIQDLDFLEKKHEK
ncbi:MULTISPECIES: DUF4238 domain-containing protein [unclassified Sphingobacterium]|uniref:DUF4238 domain-containing protein n=1 Tax=unclassified Sphingobacterium TaxID=2609468 RepID=UPI0025DCFF5A|nr:MULTISPECIES: DUF4238 domain-containing protein [unclassified Sphingobacterium]